MNWSGLNREFYAFKATAPAELEDGLNDLASRYVAVLDKLERSVDFIRNQEEAYGTA